MGAAAMSRVAFYYPGSIWKDDRWLKNALLFFDGVAVLVPRHLHERLGDRDPSLVAGLRDHDLLHVLEPEQLIDVAGAEALASALADLLAAGALDELLAAATPLAKELSLSRLGQAADPSLAGMLLEELQVRGLAGRSIDGVSVSIHWLVRLVILVLLAQILPVRGASLGLELVPATDQLNVHAALGRLLQLSSFPSEGHVVSMDLEACGTDLSSVALEEILEFKHAHGAEYQRYARSVRAAVRDLAALSEDERVQYLSDRRALLLDEGAHLRTISESWWRKPAGLALAVTGAAWTVRTGDPLGAILSGAGGVIGALGQADAGANPFSYTFRAGSLVA